MISLLSVIELAIEQGHSAWTIDKVVDVLLLSKKRSFDYLYINELLTNVALDDANGAL